MRHLVKVLVIAALAMLPAIASGQGIDGSDHDRGGKICQNCHVPHLAKGVKLWYEDTVTTAMSTIQKLCWSCHDGTGGTSIGATTVFNLAKEQHKGITANGSAGDCDGCHDVHNQNPNLTGKFLYADVTITNGTYCGTCHDGTAPTPYAAANTVGGGDHLYSPATSNHFQNGTFTCNQCHTVHGATPQTTNPSGLTKPILLANNNSTGKYGDFCISCHLGTIPAAGVTGTGGVAAGGVFDYAEATGDKTELKHPTTSAEVTGCNHCHDVHNPPVSGNRHALLLEANNDGAFCISCHTNPGAPPIGTSHPYDAIPAVTTMNSGASPALPWANQIDDDAADGGLAFGTGQDYAGATANKITCETCHSVHRKGVDGPFLRQVNTNNELCGTCHPANY